MRRPSDLFDTTAPGEDDPVRATLQRVFGLHAFRPGQREIVDEVMAGRDALVLMPTGGGKSLTFQLPALLRPGLGIIVSPLISLMKDQVDALRANGIAAAHYNSSLDAGEAREVLERLQRGELDLLYVAPERIMQDGFVETLKAQPLALIAIDEAHCVSQWGHDFRPEYVQLGELRRHFRDVPLLALTATADPQTREDIVRVLGLEAARRFIASFDRPNIRYTVREKFHPQGQLLNFLRGHERESGIVYALSRKRVEEVAEFLRQQKFAAAAYHAGLGAAIRTEVQEQFQRDDIAVVVATVAFGMGIDKPNVRFVVHYDMPRHIEGYYQETGRAGRDGLPAEALLLYGAQDAAIARYQLEQGGNDTQKRIEAHKLNAIVGLAESLTCRRRVLLGYLGETIDEDCGNCDICLDPPERFDATEAARKLLSCVYRLRQSFGIRQVVDVLRGANNERIRKFRHERLSTYGIGAEFSLAEWTSIARQLIHHGYLLQDIAAYSVLKLTRRAQSLLRGEERLQLARPRVSAPTAAPKAAEKAARKASGRSVGSVAELDASELRLFERLRSLRKRLADERGVPPYVIFGDAALLEMSRKRPANEAEFLAINGVGEVKLKRHGAEFLQAIAISPD